MLEKAEDEADQHEVHDVRQQMARDDLPMALPERARGGDVGPLALAHRLAADQPAEADPAGDAEREGHRAEALAQHEQDGDEEQDLRDRSERAVNILDEVVHALAKIAGEDAEQRAERNVDRR